MKKQKSVKKSLLTMNLLLVFLVSLSLGFLSMNSILLNQMEPPLHPKWLTQKNLNLGAGLYQPEIMSTI